MAFPQQFSASFSQAPTAVWVRLGAFLSWFGVCLCSLLVQKDAAIRAYLCPLRGGCEAVLGSQFAAIGGVPLTWVGVAFYVVVLSLWLTVVASSRWRLFLLDAILWLVLAGMTFSLGLMYVQFAVLHAFCPLCTGSALTVAALAVAAFRARPVVEASPMAASPGEAATLASFVVVPLLISLAGYFAEPQSPGNTQLVDLANAHRRGAANAVVQMVVYSDFQCGYCRELAPILQRLQREFPHEVAVVFRHFPLAGHPRAFAVAVAAECAGEQGKFWEYHDKLFAEGGGLEESRLIGLARSLGLDEVRFATCLHSEPAHAAVEASLREAERLNLPGAPSLFLNGRRLEGTLSYERLRAGIQAALLQQGSPGSAEGVTPGR